MIDLERYFENIPCNEDRIFSKKDLPSLPPCFKPTLLGEFRFGMLGQHRCKKLHAYEFGTYWSIHRDHRNPETHPIEHLVEDAPHWLAAGVVVAAAIGVSIFGYLTKDEE